MKNKFRSVIVAVSTSLLASATPSSSSGNDLGVREHAVMLKAIPRSDNGRIVGMRAALGPSSLHYAAFKGSLGLVPAGTFSSRHLPDSVAQRYARQMDKAKVYQVTNPDIFLAQNAGRTFLPPGHKPNFVTVKKGDYPDGRTATWICVLSAVSIEQFYRDQLGHERCDAFR